MNEWIEIGTLNDIPRQGARIVTTDDVDIAVFRTADDRVFAVHDKCPHKGGQLSQGIVHGARVACPMHNTQIDLETGTAVAPDEGTTPCIPVRVEGGVISLSIKRKAAKKCA